MKFIIIIAMLVLYTTISIAQGMGTITVSLSGIDSASGTVMIALEKSMDDFEADDFFTPKFRGKFFKAHKVTKGVHQVQFKGISAGDYAVKVFHDENDNGKLDANFLGIPTEKYGFSNDARGTFGPPGYEDSRFSFNGKSKLVTIEIK